MIIWLRVRWLLHCVRREYGTARRWRRQGWREVGQTDQGWEFR